MRYVFKYKLAEGKEAVADIPAECASVFAGGAETSVIFNNGHDWGNYKVDPSNEVYVVSESEAQDKARELHKDLYDSGILSASAFPAAKKTMKIND